VLRRWGPGEILAHMDFKLLAVGIHLETTVYMRLVNRLDEEGCVELLVCSAGSNMAKSLSHSEVSVMSDIEAPALASLSPGNVSSAEQASNSFLGVHLPNGSSRRFAVRAEVDCACLRLWPKGGAGLQQRVIFMLAGQEKCPVDRVVCMIWRFLAKNTVNILDKRVAECPRDAMDPERLKYYRALEEQILELARTTNPSGHPIGTCSSSLNPASSEQPPADIAAKFHAAHDLIEKRRSDLSIRDQAMLDALFIQGTQGSCPTDAPDTSDGLSKANFEAMSALGDMPRSEACVRYIAWVQNRWQSEFAAVCEDEFKDSLDMSSEGPATVS